MTQQTFRNKKFTFLCENVQSFTDFVFSGNNIQKLSKQQLCSVTYTPISFHFTLPFPLPTVVLHPNFVHFCQLGCIFVCSVLYWSILKFLASKFSIYMQQLRFYSNHSNQKSKGNWRRASLEDILMFKSFGIFVVPTLATLFCVRPRNIV